MGSLGARLVIAGTQSGVGKTTVATGLMAALRARGLVVGSAKVGPDFVDPGYHGLATGRPPRNLDAWLCGSEVLPALAGRAGAGTDVLVVEGVMGLFDGSSGEEGEEGTTAEVAALLDAPVVLVVDAWALAGSVAALVHGFASFDPSVRVGGVILNRVAGEGHALLLREALVPLGIPVLGALTNDDRLVWRERHLGLVPIAERRDEVGGSLERLAAAIERECDVDALLQLARSAPRRTVADPPAASRQSADPVRIAVAAGPAFSFVYPDNLELFEQAGAELVPFDPARDPALPPGIGGIYAGGGFPEVFAAELSANAPLLEDVRRAAGDGVVVWAECGGLLWLCRSLDGRAMAGVVDGDARMTDGLTLGYRHVRFRADNPLGTAGTEVRGHEFHASTLEPEGDALDLRSRWGAGHAGFAGPRLLASYVHLHLGARPDLAERFVAAGRRVPR